MTYADGWFKVSRRIFRSSRWYKGSPESIKVLLFLIGQAQDPLNPTPGLVQMGETAIAHQTGLTVDAAAAALEWLCSPDAESRTRTDEGCTVMRLEDGSGFELVNFEPYHPGEREKAEARREKARRAANARWGRHEAAGSDGAVDVQGAPETRVLPEPRDSANGVSVAVAPDPPSTAPSLPTGAEGVIPVGFRFERPRVRVVNGLTGEEQPFDGGGIFETLEARKEAEIEAMRIARLIADRDGTEPLEELSLASQWRDSSKLRVETMTHERLWHTLKRLRTKWEQREPKGLSLEDQARARLLGKAQA